MKEEIACKTHPDAPHGFLRNASHTENRLVCECEYWEEPKVNERIRSLADQARIRNHWSVDEGRYLTDYLDEEKFAQLIVAECLSMADKESERYSDLDQEYCSMAMDNYRELVRQHFGVKE